jgi:hypothetical protein
MNEYADPARVAEMRREFEAMPEPTDADRREILAAMEQVGIDIAEQARLEARIVSEKARADMWRHRMLTYHNSLTWGSAIAHAVLCVDPIDRHTLRLRVDLFEKVTH